MGYYTKERRNWGGFLPKILMADFGKVHLIRNIPIEPGQWP
jgi:hypothetical protein